MQQLEEYIQILSEADSIYSNMNLPFKGYDTITIEYLNGSYCDWTL
jgi:hypothetical protein